MDESPFSCLAFIMLDNSSIPFLIFSIVIILVLLLLSALISGSEVAFFSLSKEEIQLYNESENKKERALAKLLSNPKKLLATILVFNNLVNVAVVTYSTFALTHMVEKPSASLLFLLSLVITFLLVFFGELIPKVYATHNQVKFAMLNLRMLNVADKVFNPIAQLLLSLTSVVEKRIKRKEYQVSVEELTTAVEIASSVTETSEEEKEMLKGIVNFGTINVKQIMRGRTDITAFDYEMNFHELMDKINKSGYSRVPVYRDTIDNIIGILYVKDFLPYIDNEESFRWQSLVRSTYFIPESKKIDALLKNFKERRVHMAIVVDEYGGTSGLVTLEDILEEIVGEINDEFDENDIEFTQIAKDTFVFDGKTSLNDFCKIINANPRSFDDVKGESGSLGGLLLELHSSMPNVGEEITHDHFLFTVESVSDKRIKRIRVKISKEKVSE